MIRKSIPKKFGFSLVIFLLASSVFILLFATLPSVHESSAFSTDQAASHVVGQPDFVSSGCAYGSPTASTVCSPYGVAFDSSGNLWVADEGDSRVLEYPSSSLTSNGPSASLALGSPSLTGRSCPSSSYPTTTSPGYCLSDIREIALNSSGTLFVADHGEEGIVAFSPPFSTGMNGTLVLGGKGCTSNQSSICQPDGMAFDSSGNLWVTDGSLARVLEFTPPFKPGELASVVIGQPDFTTRTSTGACNPATSLSLLCEPKGIAFDSSGNLWVSDYGGDRVLEFKAPFLNGTSASLVIGTGGCTAPTSTSLCSPRGIAFDSSGNLWVADTGYNRVLEFASPYTGGASIVLGQIDSTSDLFPSASQSTFSGPEDLAFDASGNLWVSDNSNSRVLEFALTTSTTTTTSSSTTSSTSTSSTTTTSSSSTTSTSTITSTSTSSSSTTSTTSSTSTSTVPTRAHVSITLNPFLPSNAISANNYFLVTYTDEGTTNWALEQGGTLQIIADIGSTINIAAASSGSNAAEQWCLSATSSGTCQPTTILVGASGASVTYVYYDIQLQFVGYEISGGGTPIAPYFGVYATAPLVVTSSPSARDATITSLPLSATSYASIWLLAGTVAVFEPIINTNPTAASQQWQGVPACDILFVGAISCGNFVSDYQVGPFSQGGVFITIDYHHQYSQQVSFSVIGSGTGYSAPTLNYVSAGSSQLLTLTQSASSLFLDAGSSWSVTPNPLAGSTPSNSWTASSGTAGTVTGPGTIDPVYVKSVLGQIPANLQESFGVSDKYVPSSSATLVDLITLEDTYIAPLTAPLFDGITVNDYFVSPLKAALNDLVGVGEKLASSTFLESGVTFPGNIFFIVHSPVNILVTDTQGRQAGFNSTGSMINTIPGAQIIPKNGTQLETIIIPDPLSGQYTVEVFPVNGGGNYTIESQSTNANGTVVADTRQTGSVTSGSQYLGVTLTPSGQVTESPPSITPPFQNKSSTTTLIITVAVIAAAIAVAGSALFVLYRRKKQ